MTDGPSAGSKRAVRWIVLDWLSDGWLRDGPRNDLLETVERWKRKRKPTDEQNVEKEERLVRKRDYMKSDTRNDFFLVFL